MIAVDVYRPDQWHDFFIVVGGGAAVLTGLVFVAMSLNVNVINQDATHRYRAVGTLTGMSAAFVICSLALMGGQDHRAVGIEWFVVAAIAAVVYINGYVQAVRLGGSVAWLRVNRVVVGSACYLAELVGAALLVAGHIAGLYVAAVAMILQLAFMISGAWLLVIGVATRQPPTPRSEDDA
ncbi:MAG: hypothetical protein ACHQDE_00465 [Acidimicrobiia bacterium]